MCNLIAHLWLEYQDNKQQNSENPNKMDDEEDEEEEERKFQASNNTSSSQQQQEEPAKKFDELGPTNDYLRKYFLYQVSFHFFLS